MIFKSTERKFQKAFIYITIIVLAFFMYGCGRSSDLSSKQASATKPSAPVVTVARPISTDVVEWNYFTGRLDAVNKVDIRARVSGYLESVHFKEGAKVKKGDLLFVIDPRPYQAELDRTQGQLETVEANFRLAKIEQRRAEQLLKQQAYSQETYDQRLAAMRQAEGNVEAAKAAVTAARLNLEFTQIQAPIDGMISKLNVTPGNLIDGGSSQSTLLTTIVSLDPIYCYFTVDERSHLQYVRLVQQGKLPTDVKFPVWLEIADEKNYPHLGYVDFVDNHLDPGTATINVRAVFPNPNLVLSPGLFARVKTPATAIEEALLIPEASIMTDQAQKIAYVVNKEGIVEQKQLETGPRQGDLRIIKQGLSADDLVIINGIQRARPGQHVKAVEGRIPEQSKEVIPKEVRDLFSANANKLKSAPSNGAKPNNNSNPAVQE